MFKTFIATAIVVASVSAAEASDALKNVVSSYLEIQAQLAADKTDGIKAPATRIVTDAAQLEGGKDIVAGAKELEQAGDIKKAREAFGKLSTALIPAVKAAGGIEGLKLGYCPMVAAPWLQKDGQVRNPYYGSAMLTCGELRDPRK